jgi:hypothetical protein
MVGKTGFSHEGKNKGRGSYKTGFSERYFDVKRRKEQDTKEICIIESFKICTQHG